MQAYLETLAPGSEEWRLAAELDAARLPAHIAIIMDGNGRWANRRRLPRVAGHRAGVEPVRISVETCARLGLKALTLYAFSVENWKRPRREVETLWQLLRYYLRQELPRLKTNNIRLRIVGRIHELSVDIQRALADAEAATAANTGLVLNLAINYGGRTEIVDAVNRAIDEARRAGTLDTLRLTEALLDQNLYTAGLPEPDLLIRTSGEMRVSNFLLWQIAYAELYVTQTCWPDFNEVELLRALIAYQKRDRRFGGVAAPELEEQPQPEVVSVPVR
jgi:undecaprenyl diphosphate synthase